MLLFGESERLWLAKQQSATLKKIVITGSCGKSTVRELVASILALKQKVLVGDASCDANRDASAQMLNGVSAADSVVDNADKTLAPDHPLAQLAPTHDRLVLELGGRGPGDLAQAAEVIRPDVALVTGVGEADLSAFATVEAMATALGAVYDGLPEEGCAVINFDDAFAPHWLRHVAGKSALTFSIFNTKPADVLLMQARYVPRKGSFMSIKTPKGQVEVKTQLLGEHNWVNVLAAVAAVLPLGVTLDDIAKGISTVAPGNGRLQHRAASFPDWILLDDTCSANPMSARAAIDVLATCRGRRILVLGYMPHLGDRASQLHCAVGQYARQRLIDDVIGVGPQAEEVRRGFGGGHVFQTCPEIITYLSALSAEPCAVLVKGGHDAQLSSVVHAFSA